MKLFCFDVDGTLRDNTPEHNVPLSAIKTLKALQKKGHKLVVSTGRGLDSLKRTQIFDILDWDGFVINNGQLVLDGKENILERNVFDPQAVIETIKVADRLNLPVTLKKDHRIITREPDDYVYTTQQYFGNIIPEVGRYNGKDDVYAMCLYGPLGYDYEPFTHVKGVHVAPGMSTYADATIAGVSKATGNNVFVKKYQTDGYIAFGDSQNDLEMFKGAKLSICMGNGDPITKDQADYVTAALDDDGIMKACLHYGWIRKEDIDD